MGSVSYLVTLREARRRQAPGRSRSPYCTDVVCFDLAFFASTKRESVRDSLLTRILKDSQGSLTSR